MDFLFCALTLLPNFPWLSYISQGRVRTKTVKRSARVIVERYYAKLALDFDTNKKVTDEVAVVPSKRMRNKIAGWVTVSIEPYSMFLFQVVIICSCVA